MTFKSTGELNAELYHHGVLGMHWGVRRYQPYGSGGYTPKKSHAERKAIRTEKNAQKESEKIEKGREAALNSSNRKIVNKNKQYLTDDELRNKVQRFQDEDYLATKTAKQISHGQKVALDVLGHVGKMAITAGAVYLGAKYAKKVIKNSDTFKTAMKAASAISDIADKAEKTVDFGKKVAKTTTNVAYNVGKKADEVGKATLKGMYNVGKKADEAGKATVKGMYNVGKAVDTVKNKAEDIVYDAKKKTVRVAYNVGKFIVNKKRKN